MKASANEVMTLATKAARGGGAPPDQAASFGRAALCHLVADRAKDDLSTALDALPDGPILDVPLGLLQMMESAEGMISKGAFPASDLLISYLEAQPFGFEVIDQSDDELTVRMMLNAPKSAKPIARITLPETLATKMQTLAANILVPDTAASRLSGAGAGLTDND